MTEQEGHNTALLLHRLAHATLLDGRAEWSLAYARAALALSGEAPALLALKAYAALYAEKPEEATDAIERWQARNEPQEAAPLHLLKALLAIRQQDAEATRAALGKYAADRSLPNA